MDAKHTPMVFSEELIRGWDANNYPALEIWGYNMAY